MKGAGGDAKVGKSVSCFLFVKVKKILRKEERRGVDEKNIFENRKN